VTDRTYIDIHVIQSVPPSNLNRDDGGSPKQAMYGGVRRARVSSQAWKRATRLAFSQQLPPDQRGTRTKRIATLLADRLSEQTGITPEDAARISATLLEPLGIKPGKREDETAYLIFFGRGQIERVVDLVAERSADLAKLSAEDLKKELSGTAVKDQIGTGHPIDVALFGRMVADLADLNIDAATQVAHAISTHAVETEFDYFTAVDDEKPREEPGAGMTGTVEFNSATLYRFATVGLHQLLENLGDDVDATLQALELFIRAFVLSMPSGYEHSFAPRTPPSLLSVVVRADQPVNLVSAFERPVHSSSGFLHGSSLQLAREMRRASQTWGLTPLLIASSFDPPEDPGDAQILEGALGEARSFEAVVGSTIKSARSRLSPAGQ